MTVGFAAAVDVDLSLVTEDREPCLYPECSAEAVWGGIITTPCGHPQPLCLRHYEVEAPRWMPGDSIFCWTCTPRSEEDQGTFVRWERL
ncbi:MAG TPA: hypothetical protein VD864_03065 [Nocardioides sp.]|nr:hypothetical protein [Nocardioides sp.]